MPTPAATRISQRFSGTVMLVCTNALRPKRGHSGQHGHWYQKQKRDDFFRNTNGSRICQSSPVCNYCDVDKGDLHEPTLCGNRYTDAQALLHDRAPRSEIPSGDRHVSRSSWQHPQRRTDANCLSQRRSQSDARRCCQCKHGKQRRCVANVLPSAISIPCTNRLPNAHHGAHGKPNDHHRDHMTDTAVVPAAPSNCPIISKSARP